MLGAGAYLTGLAGLAGALACAALGAARARSRLLGWSGPPAWIADSILVLAGLIVVGALVGAVGLFRESVYLPLVALIGLGLRFGLEPAPRIRREQGPPAPDEHPLLRIAAIAVAALVVAHWSIGVRAHLSVGMTGFDTTWYHGPLAALFEQSGSTWELHRLAPDFLTWFYPANSELLHAVGIVAFGRDIASPVLTLAFLIGSLLAAWCVGRPYGAGSVSVLGTALLLDSGVLADQAGEARNDIVVCFFLLAAAALVVNAGAASRDGRPGRGGLALAGLAAGLAAGTKLNMLVPAAALLAGVALAAAAGSRRSALVALGLPMLGAGGFWYLRNLLHSGNPLPWVKEIGPVSLPAPEQPLGGREQHSFLHYLFDGSVWSDWFLPGLHSGLGILWPALLALAGAGALLCLGRQAAPAVRVAALVACAGIVTWMLEPSSAAGPEGEAVAFASNLRHLAPALAVGLALAPLAPQLRSGEARLAIGAAALLSLPFADASGLPWSSGYLVGAALVGLAAAALAWTAASRATLRSPRAVLGAGVIAAALLTAGGGYAAQRDYLQDRYAKPTFAAPGLNAAFAWAREVRDARIATVSTRQYPLFGTDLSNEVTYVGERRSHGGYVDVTTCRAWRQALNEGAYDYVVASRDRIEPGKPAFPIQVVWTRAPGARVVLRKPPTVVFQLNSRLDPSACR